MSKSSYVSDSFALLVYLNGEAGEARLVDVLKQSQAGKCRVLLCIINLGEVLYMIERRRGCPERESWVFKFNPCQKWRALFGWSSTYKGVP